MLLPFVLVTTLFFAWGFANDITNPMVKAFSKIFRMSVMDGALVQLAFYGGYFAMAFPAALFIRKYSYKAGILVGLALYAGGALLFIPASMTGVYYPFLVAYFILTCGLSFLETSSNPYILTMGDEATSTRRLNLAQAFNPIGSLLGMFTAMTFIQARLNPLSTAERAVLSPEEFEAVKHTDLQVLITPYVAVGLVVLILFLVIRFTKMPKNADRAHSLHIGRALKRIFSISRYREGVIAQFFYVGVQIMCWTFIIQYGTRIFVSQGMNEQAAEVLSQRYNIVAMAIFLREPFCLYFFVEVCFSWQVAHGFGYRRCGIDYWSHRFPGYLGIVLSGGRFCLHVPDVSHHLRDCFAGVGGRCQIRGCRIDYGNFGRFGDASFAGCYH